MTETDYIIATNLAKLRIADMTLRDLIEGYGPITAEWRREVCKLTGDIPEKCFEKIKTEEADGEQ